METAPPPYFFALVRLSFSGQHAIPCGQLVEEPTFSIVSSRFVMYSWRALLSRV